MKPFVLPVFAMFVAGLLATLLELIRWIFRPPKARDINIALFCLLSALYALFSVLQYNADNVADTVIWLKLQSTVISLAGISLLYFFALGSDEVKKPLFRSSIIFFAVLSLVPFLGLGDLILFSGEEAPKQVVLPFGISWTFHEAESGLVTDIANYLSFIIFPYFFYLAIKHSHRAKTRTFSLLPIPIIILLASINDNLVGSAIIHTPYLLEYSYVIVVFYVYADRAFQEKLSLEHIEQLAFYDSLTGLPNRSLFHEFFAAALARADRFGGKVALLFIDLDRFKYVNDVLGHSAGDLCLVYVASTLKAKLRDSDLVSRLGGDEFTVLIESSASIQDVKVVARSIISALTQPYAVKGSEFLIGCSIGIAIYPDDDSSIEGLMRKADSAMYEAKAAGGNSFFFASNEIDRQNKEHAKLEVELSRAFDNEEFLLHYQPLVDISSQKIINAEALLRWRRPDGMIVAPSSFIGILEESGQIVQVGEWVIRKACAEAGRWQSEGHDIAVSVNVSPRQLREGNIVEVVRDALEASELPPEKLIIEITESLLMSNLKRAEEDLSGLRQLGVLLAIDDFGTGYSSLSYLSRFPFSELKIDQSFLNRYESDQRVQSIVRAIVAMALSLNLSIVAEGVETESHRSYLSQLSSSIICQGYYYSRPLDIDNLKEYLKLHAGQHSM